MTPLRIAHIANEAYGFETANGVQQVVYCLTRAQAELGHAVALFSRDDNAVHVIGDCAESALARSRAVPTGGSRSFREPLLALYLEHTLLANVLAWRPEIVHFHSVHEPRNVALAPWLRRAGIPYCVTVHGALFPPALRRSWVRKTAFNRLFERRYLNEAQFIHAVSPQEIDAIRRIGVVQPIVTVPNGLPPGSNLAGSQPEALFAERPSLRRRKLFMFMGRIDAWQKGLDLLVRAFAQVALPDTALVFVGPDYRGSRHELERLAEKLGVSSQLAFVGPAFGQERANLFSAADVFVHPSRWEGLSLSVLAAAAIGKVSLITREADPLGELERARAAILVEPSVAGVAEGLRQAAALDDGEMRNMGARARRVAEAEFTWPPIAAKLVDTYRSALENVHDHSG